MQLGSEPAHSGCISITGVLELVFVCTSACLPEICTLLSALSYLFSLQLNLACSRDDLWNGGYLEKNIFGLL